jgi:transposase InsO family protein
VAAALRRLKTSVLGSTKTGSLLSDSSFTFIEGWYNPRRRHSALDYLSPVDYEKRTKAETHIASP